MDTVEVWDKLEIEDMYSSFALTIEDVTVKDLQVQERIGFNAVGISPVNTLVISEIGNISLNDAIQHNTTHDISNNGILMLAVRTDTQAPLTTTDGDYSGLQLDSSGNLRVIVESSGGVGDNVIVTNTVDVSANITNRVVIVIVCLSGTSDEYELLRDIPCFSDISFISNVL